MPLEESANPFTKNLLITVFVKSSFPFRERILLDFTYLPVTTKLIASCWQYAVLLLYHKPNSLSVDIIMIFSFPGLSGFIFFILNIDIW